MLLKASLSLLGIEAPFQRFHSGLQWKHWQESNGKRTCAPGSALPDQRLRATLEAAREQSRSYHSTMRYGTL